MAGSTESLSRPSLIGQIFATYRDPRGVIREQRDRGVGEERVLFYVIAAGLLIFVARLPGLTRQAGDLGSGVEEIGGIIGSWFLISVIVFALLWYGIAALARLTCRFAGGQGTGFEARHALFWATLATTPFLIAAGSVEALGLVTQQNALSLAGRYLGLSGLGGLLLLWLWAGCLAELEGFRSQPRVFATILAVLLGLAGLALLAFGQG
ncbi:MAG: YIP1 family protein [Pseudomonadota bacterium]